MDLSSILSLGGFGLGLFGSFKSAQISRKQASIYEEQAELNRQIGSFNAAVSELSGIKAVEGMAQQTKRMIGEQKVAFSNRGITLEGSPMLVLGDTLTMGAEKAQEEYFNAQVQKINYQYAAIGATATATSHAEEARYKGLSSTITAAKQIMGSPIISESLADMGVKQGVNILKYWA